ncbi:MAG TPA: phosphate/phosphite/phosphonate ABC transporter substrate-binding protein [Ignavibacteriaceae bacterium]|nr:phosphate/phosphite/phosphonate ABC transporter substrate-binding protein [Ignavibacteriaceae bacterium]
MKRFTEKIFKNFTSPMRKKYFIALLSLIFIGIVATIIFYNYAVDISTNIPADIKPEESKPEKNKTLLYVGVISRYPPNIIFKGYQPIIDYLNQNDKYHFELKLSTNYSETVNQLINNDVVVAFFGSLLYVNAHERYGIIPILKPLNEDFKPFFKSVLFAKKESNINSVHDLIGKKIAVPSKESFSGNWLIRYELIKNNIKESQIKEIKNFAYHQNVIFQVLNGSFDAGVVKDRVMKEYEDRKIKVIAYSEPVPGSPIVAAKNYNSDAINIIKSLLLKIDLSKSYYKELVKNWDKEFTFGFVEANDADYNLIRKYAGLNN